MNHKWDEARDQQLTGLWADGLPAWEIAVRMRTTTGAIMDRRCVLGLPLRKVSGGWRDDEIETVRTRWVNGESASQIAKALPGRTRNAVIGLCHRRGWTKEHRLIPSGPRATCRPVKAPRVRPVVTNKPPKPGPHNRPGEVFGKVQHETNPAKVESVRAAMRVIGGSAEQRVESGAGVESPNARPFMEATKGCKWPIGSGLSMLYCCNPKRTEGGPYCSGHHAVSISDFQPVLRPRDAARLTRFDRVERDGPAKREPMRTLWDDARLEAA